MNIDIKVSERISCEKGKRCGSDDKKRRFFFLYSNLKPCKIFGNGKLQTGHRNLLKIVGFYIPLQLMSL